jgi:hypothetical protein
MATITIQDLQDIAVKSTSDFFNDNIPLNQSLAKQASERGLNSEQLKRAVEATNTLTHLKSIEISQDRTSEFPVADYGQILKLAAVPNLTGTPPEDKDGVDETDSFGFVEKTASVNAAEDSLAYSHPVLSQREIITHIFKQASLNERKLEDAKIELEIIGTTMLKKIAALKTDPEIVEHLSASSASKSYFEKTAALIVGPGATRRDLPNGMFKVASLKDVEEFLSLYKKAEDLTAEIKWRQELHDRWVPQKETLTKQAFVGHIGEAVGKGIAKVVTAPFKALGNAVVKSVSSTATYAGNKAYNAVAGTKVGKSLGATARPIDASVGRKIGAAGAVGAGLIDSSMYTPKVNPAGDNSGKVWEALQG